MFFFEFSKKIYKLVEYKQLLAYKKMKIHPLRTVIRIIFITFLVSFGTLAHTNNYALQQSYFEHLYEVNKEWKHHKNACQQGNVTFNSDLDRIQLHLNLVIQELRSNIPENFTIHQQSNRLFLLDKLQEYADKKIFPINTYHSVRQPYFVDNYGTNCAVGQMIYVSGYEQLVAQISQEHNYDYIEDIHTEGLLEWADEFGFTVDELKWIQPGYAPNVNINQVLNGTNGTVKKIIPETWHGGLIIAGEFTELDSLPCLNIGHYKNNQLSCYGNGLDGVINDVVYRYGYVYAFGLFQHNGEVFPIAKYNGSSWSFIEIPQRVAAMGTAGIMGGGQYQFEVAIEHDSNPHHQEIWIYSNENTWKKKMQVNGFISNVLNSAYGFVYAGHFNSVTVYNPDATTDTTLTVNNVVINNEFNGPRWYGIEGEISDTVNVIKKVGNTLIFGGTCTAESGESKVCLTRYFNSVLQPLLINTPPFTDYSSVNALAYQSGNRLYFGGDFQLMPIVGTVGYNAAYYDLISNRTEALALFDEPVNALVRYDGELYLGGDFTINGGSSNKVNYLARTMSTSDIKEIQEAKYLKVYPNPFNSSLTVENTSDGTPYSLLYLDGRVAATGSVVNE